jgi:hypothetical protein
MHSLNPFIKKSLFNFVNVRLKRKIFYHIINTVSKFVRIAYIIANFADIIINILMIKIYAY